jgi:hypothetical protein
VIADAPGQSNEKQKATKNKRPRSVALRGRPGSKLIAYRMSPAPAGEELRE